jgi:hypothetical protein
MVKFTMPREINPVQSGEQALGVAAATPFRQRENPETCPAMAGAERGLSRTLGSLARHECAFAILSCYDAVLAKNQERVCYPKFVLP